MRQKNSSMTSLASVALVCMALLPSTTLAKAQEVYAPDAMVAGKCIDEWGAEWIQWTFSFPYNATNPSVDPTGHHAWDNQPAPDKVFMMPCNISGELMRERTFNVPGGVPLLIPLDAQLASEAFAPGASVDDLRAYAAGVTASVSFLGLSVDGVEVPDLFSHRETFPDPFQITLPNDSYGAPAGSYTTVSDGYFVMLKPLSPGMHTIHAQSKDDISSDNDVAHVTAVPEPGAWMLLTGLLVPCVSRLRRRRA